MYGRYSGPFLWRIILIIWLELVHNKSFCSFLLLCLPNVFFNMYVYTFVSTLLFPFQTLYLLQPFQSTLTLLYFLHTALLSNLCCSASLKLERIRRIFSIVFSNKWMLYIFNNIFFPHKLRITSGFWGSICKNFISRKLEKLSYYRHTYFMLALYLKCHQVFNSISQIIFIWWINHCQLLVYCLFNIFIFFWEVSSSW